MKPTERFDICCLALLLLKEANTAAPQQPWEHPSPWANIGKLINQSVLGTAQKITGIVDSGGNALKPVGDWGQERWQDFGRTTDRWLGNKERGTWMQDQQNQWKAQHPNGVAATNPADLGQALIDAAKAEGQRSDQLIANARDTPQEAHTPSTGLTQFIRRPEAPAASPLPPAAHPAAIAANPEDKWRNTETMRVGGDLPGPGWVWDGMHNGQHVYHKDQRGYNAEMAQKNIDPRSRWVGNSFAGQIPQGPPQYRGLGVDPITGQVWHTPGIVGQQKI